jgi:hypothetical protein
MGRGDLPKGNAALLTHGRALEAGIDLLLGGATALFAAKTFCQAPQDSGRIPVVFARLAVCSR